MADRTQLALAAFDRLRRGAAYGTLSLSERQALEHNMGRIARVLGGGRAAAATAADPYARLLGTPADLERDLQGGGSSSSDSSTGSSNAAPAPAPSAPPPPPVTSQIGQRTADALEAVNFPGFVAALVTGTFQAIVDASAQQIREYANLVASISQSVESFSQDKVSPNQTRDWLREHHPQDLALQLPAPGKTDPPKLIPAPDREGQSPDWLKQYGLEGQEMTAELTDGPLVDAARNKVGEERMQTLATLVLMGINRVVVNDGDIRARLQFHASGRDVMKAEVEQQQGGIAAQATNGPTQTMMMVSTVKANAQADASIKADLMGEVRIAFRSETFPLERFADSAAIQLINRHARWQKETPPAAGGAPPTGGTTASSPAPSASAPVEPAPAAAAPGGAA